MYLRTWSVICVALLLVGAFVSLAALCVSWAARRMPEGLRREVDEHPRLKRFGRWAGLAVFATTVFGLLTAVFDGMKLSAADHDAIDIYLFLALLTTVFLAPALRWYESDRSNQRGTGSA
jgi:hypothetical protein